MSKAGKEVLYANIHCLDCKRERRMRYVRRNKGGRPVWQCPEGHSQAALVNEEDMEVEHVAPDGGVVEEERPPIVRDSSPDYIDRPTFDTDQVVDWDCPCCGEAGFDDRRTSDYLPICTNSDCPVKLFAVFRGEPDEE